jgi:hypothetical protein
MSADAIWNRARTDLVILTEQGDEDPFLWEHSARVANSAQQIAKLSTVQSASPDETAILAAALYHDSGWIVRLKAGEVERREALLRPLSEADREQSAVVLERRLGRLLPPQTLVRAAEAIRTLKDREIESIEGQVVTEADNLDEFGVLSLWTTIRRGTIEGKGVQAVVETWRRRKEYRYWDALLKDSFRFPAVRAVAQTRLEQFDRLMQELETQHDGADVVFPRDSQLAEQPVRTVD